jgi:hypothetical protein
MGNDSPRIPHMKISMGTRFNVGNTDGLVEWRLDRSPVLNVCIQTKIAQFHVNIKVPLTFFQPVLTKNLDNVLMAGRTKFLGCFSFMINIVLSDEVSPWSNKLPGKRLKCCQFEDE